MSDTREKLCIFCRNFRFDSGEPDYSDQTPGWDAIIECGKGHWSMNNCVSRDQFRDAILGAAKCKDYEAVYVPTPTNSKDSNQNKD